MKRGEVWWAELTPPIGRRPVLILTRDAVCDVRNQLTVALVTTRVRNLTVEVGLGPEDGMPRSCVVNLDTIATIPKRMFDERIARLREDKMTAVETAVRIALGMSY